MKYYNWTLSVTMNCTVQNKKLVFEGLPFCANVWIDGVVLICVQSTSILEDLYFCFQKTGVHLLTCNVVFTKCTV